MTDRSSPENPAPRARGRPRRLKLDQIIEAALAIGLNQFTMAAVADHLGVGKAVLYGYVANREELLKIAMSRAVSHHLFPSDQGQHWALWVLDYSRALFEVLSQDGDMLEVWLSGQQSSVIEVESTETWLRVLARAGFEPLEAVQLRRAASYLVIGSAAAVKRGRALKRAGRPRSAAMPKLIASRARVDGNLMRSVVEELSRDDQERDWERQLFWIVSGAIATYKGQPDVSGFADLPTDALFQQLPEILS